MIASADTRFVRATGPNNGNGLTWATAYRNLRDALDAAAANPAIDQIWVAAGTYTPRRGGANRNDRFTLVSHVALYGGFSGSETLLSQRDPTANVTILSGDIDTNDTANFGNRTGNSRQVVRADDVIDARVDGFTIRGGNADFPGDQLMGGGGMHLHRSEVTVEGCIFTDNIAGGTAPDLGGFGGALLVQGGNVEIANCDFIANRGMNGGALGIFGSEQDRTEIDTVVSARDCDFTNNFSPSQTGGAIWSSTGDPLPPSMGIIGDIRFERCVFSGNHAEYYGAWTDYNTPDLRVQDCRFSGNSSVVAGGALAMAQTVGFATTPKVVGCTFEQNTNSQGGGAAVFIQARPVLFESCVIRGNIGPSAIRSGPVIGFSAGSKDLELRNCLVHDNTGTGVFGFRNPALRVLNSTITRNISGIAGGLAGGIETSAALVDVSNTILWENRRGAVMDEAAQIRVFDVAPFVNYCIVQGLSGVLGGVGNLGVDPLFEDADDDNFRLSTGSPAIDAGDSTRVAADVTDLDLDGNIAETTPFDLSGRARFANDPTTADTGVAGGLGVVVDLGAFEFEPCRTDTDGDGDVDIVDLSNLLANFGVASGATQEQGDFDGDGDVDLSDLSLLLSFFGMSCA